LQAGLQSFFPPPAEKAPESRPDDRVYGIRAGLKPGRGLKAAPPKLQGIPANLAYGRGSREVAAASLIFRSKSTCLAGDRLFRAVAAAIPSTPCIRTFLMRQESPSALVRREKIQESIKERQHGTRSVVPGPANTASVLTSGNPKTRSDKQQKSQVLGHGDGGSRTEVGVIVAVGARPPSRAPYLCCANNQPGSAGSV